MNKYFVLYLAPPSVIEKIMATTTEEERKKDMDAWTQWMKNHKEDLVDPGAPLGKTKRVTFQGVVDVKNDVLGYSIVQADSHESAAELFADSPHLQMEGTTIDVMKIGEMPSM